jgi:hypothetical protein
MSNYEVKPVGATPKKFANILSALALMAFGAFIIVAYATDTFPAASGKPMWLIGMLAFFGLSLLSQAVFRTNSSAFWCSIVFLWCAFAVTVFSFTDFGADQGYPAFVLAPAVASAATWLFSRSKATHLKVIIFFSSIALILFMNSLRAIALNGWVIGGIMTIAVGGMALVNAFHNKRGKWDDGDRPQRKHPL